MFSRLFCVCAFLCLRNVTGLRPRERNLVRLGALFEGSSDLAEIKWL